MTTIYLAAPWACKDEAKQVRDRFQAEGITVNSHWLDYHGQTSDKWDPKVLEREAIQDLQDLVEADGLVVLHYKISEGKSFEQGFFLGISGLTNKTNKIVVVIPDDFGPSHNIFHYLTDVYDTVKTVEEAIEKVKSWDSKTQPLQTATN